MWTTVQQGKGDRQMDGIDKWDSAVADARAAIIQWRRDALELESTIETLVTLGAGDQPSVAVGLEGSVLPTR